METNNHFNKESILRELESYNLHLSNVTIMSILGLLGGRRFNILNTGQAGIGKSRSTLELAKLLNLNDIVCLAGHITPLKFFELLENNPNSVFIIDESSQILNNNPELIHLLRSALYDSRIVWYSSFKNESGQQIVREVNFRGSIIFNCNYFKSFSLNDKAFLDRLYVTNIRLTTAEIIDKMQDKYVPNIEIWQIIRDRIIQVRAGMIRTKFTEDEKSKINDYIIDKVKSITLSYNANISMRLFEKIREIFYRFKLFFEEIDWEYCKKLTEPYFLDINAQENFINQAIISNGGKIKIKELVQIIVDFENISLRTAYRRINEFCEMNQEKIITQKREILMRELGFSAI